MSEEKSSYRQIMKATSLFGGVQVFNIIIAIIRSKFVAILLGPTGMGISGLLSSTTGLLSNLTNFGLGTSAVKDIAAASETGDAVKISKTATVFRRLVWITGLLGAILTLILSSVLSEFVFDSDEYTFAFIWLSVTVLFAQLTSGQFVLLQGLRKLKDLAKANMVGASFGLVISIPIYYVWGLDGIVPALVITSVLALVISLFYGRKVNIGKVEVTKKETVDIGKGMLQMGFMLSLSGLITSGASYLVRIFISNQGGVDDVGLFNAGFGILFTYVGLIFAAMATDFYPRLSGVAHDNKKATLLINQQAEVGILILAPILTLFFIFINWIIIILYSTKFTPVNGMIQWAALGMYFKVASWSVAFILLAKGESRIFFWNELVVNLYQFGLNLLGYYWMGLDGLGISFLVSYFLYLVQVFFLARYRYQFRFNGSFIRIGLIQFLIGVVCFGIIRVVPSPWAYLAGLPFIGFSFYYSYRELDKRLGIRSLLANFIKKK